MLTLEISVAAPSVSTANCDSIKFLVTTTKMPFFGKNVRNKTEPSTENDGEKLLFPS